MSVALTLLGQQGPIAGQTRIQCRLTLSGNYATFVSGTPPTGGDTINFTSLIGQAVGSVGVFAQNNPPIYGAIQGSTGDDYDFVPGTNLTNNIVVINTASNTQLAASGYPARISGDLNLYGEFIFQELL